MAVPVGIGQGAAQVIDPNVSMRFYAQMMEQKQARDFRDQKLAADMLEDYGINKNKVRPQDAGEYASMYNRLQDLHINNKGLYTNPLKYPEAYKEAQRLKADMMKYAGESRQMSELTGTWSDMVKSGKQDELEDGLGDQMAFINKSSLSDIKKQFGEVPTVDMIKYKPKMPDMTSFGKDLYAIADNFQGGFDDVRQPLVTNAQNSAVPVGQVETRVDRVYKPEALLQALDYLSVSPKYKNLDKAYAYSFGKRSAAEIEDMQKKIDAMPGGQQFKITDGKSYALADTILQYGTKRGEAKLSKDEVYERQQKEADFRRQQNKEITLESIRNKHANERIEKRGQISAANKAAGTDALKTDVRNLLTALRNGDVSTDKIQEMAGGIVGLIGGAMDGETIQVLDPGKSGFAGYKNAVKNWDDNAFSKAYTSGMNEKNAETMYRRNVKVIAIATMKDGQRKYIVISPAQAHSEEKLFGLLKTLNASEKKGFDTFDRMDEE